MNHPGIGEGPSQGARVRPLGRPNQPVLADGDHGVGSLVITASRGGKSVTVNDALIFRLPNGQVREFRDAFY